MEESVGALQALRRLAEECVNAKGKQELQESTTQGLLLLLQLKEESRKLAFQAEDQREETSKFKTRLEQAHLQLQNLLYEKEYYEKEIHECQNFRFKHPDSAVGLVPSEQFLQSASPDTLESIGGDAHKLMLERLRDELAQRKAMVAKLEELRATKAATRQEVDKRKRTLDDLQQQLQGLEETAKPLQTILAPHLSLRGFARSADLLPLPLYIVYSQLAAVREALGMPIRVAIYGSSVEAESFAKAQTVDPADAAGDASQPPSSTATAAAQPAAEPAAKQPRYAGPGAAGGPSTPAQSSEDLYKVHPLSVLLEVQRENNGRMQTFISVKFQFLVNLKLVTAHSEVRDDNVLLAALFPGDDGSATAYESLAQMQGGTFKYDATRPAKPFRWCQHLAGLDFAPPLPLATQLAGQSEAGAAVLEGLESYRRQQRVIHVIDRLRAVKTGDEALKKILSSLDKAPNPPNLTRYPKLPLTSVASVEEIKTQASAAAANGNGGAAAGALAGGRGGREAGARSDSSLAPAAAGWRRPPPAAAATQQPASALPAHMRAEAGAMMEDGEVGRRSGSRPTTPACDGAASPMDATAAGAAPSASASAAIPRSASGTAQPPASAAGAAADEAMEDGEAGAEEGERTPDEEEEEGEDGGGGPSAPCELVARYLLADALAAEGGGGSGTGPGGAAAAAAAPKPVSRLYRILLRHKSLECEVLARLFLEYPLRPPLLLVRGVREAARERRGQPRPIEDVNLVAWLEAEIDACDSPGGPLAQPNQWHVLQ
ncbi:THO complex subunit 5, partial [Tetrabaena socialis]